MPCYHPLVGIFDGKYNENGKKVFKIEGKLVPSEVKIMHPGSVTIPCGRCIGCRLDYSRSWADRMMLEMESCDRKAIFLTLTYNNSHGVPCMVSDYEAGENEYFPQDGLVRLNGDKAYLCEAFTLYKRDVQLFMKRLRKHFKERKIRFYAAGEYGDHTFRPHYHIILFGISFDDIPDLCLHGCNELGQSYYISRTFSSIWRNGFVLLSNVSWRTCAYVARYVTKKVGSILLTQDYLNQEPVFALMSRKPGIGAFYLGEHPHCLDFTDINLSTPEGALKIKLPKYYLKQLQKEGSEKYPNPLYNPDKYDKLMEERRLYADDKMLLELQRTDLGFFEYLEVKENEKLEKISALRRSSV